MLVAQLALNAVALGAAYALVAIGFVLVLNATTAVNFAHGESVVAGGFIAVALTGVASGIWPSSLPGIIFLPGVLLLTALLGLAIASLAYLPIRNKPPVSVFVTTIAFGIIVTNGLNAGFGAAPRTVPALLGSGTVEIFGITASRQSLAIIATATLLIGMLAILLQRTQLGRKFRASAQDPEMARALGIRLTRITLLGFALGTAFAGAAGLLLAHQFFITPFDGVGLILKAYVAVVIGGWGSLRGATLGAMLIATFEVAVASVSSQSLAEGLLYIAVLLVLLIRPEGIFGETQRLRA
ncbi:MAG: branched-chain amino acid ABC transporter permease [Alphaproteobacteria bacterium]|nr:branched-chain amino acid ABC transporter permease [Alphaproteobacteria bacterium]